jgi:lactate permease
MRSDAAPGPIGPAPYLPDVTGAIVCFAALLILLKLWRPRRVLGYGGKPVPASELTAVDTDHGLTGGEIFQAWLPIIVLVLLVVAWTGPWSKLPGISRFHTAVAAQSSVAQNATIAAAFDFKPAVDGTAILVSWIIVALLLRIDGRQLGEIWNTTWRQMWGACLAGVFIFG